MDITKYLIMDAKNDSDVESLKIISSENNISLYYRSDGDSEYYTYSYSFVHFGQNEKILFSDFIDMYYSSRKMDLPKSEAELSEGVQIKDDNSIKPLSDHEGYMY